MSFYAATSFSTRPVTIAISFFAKVSIVNLGFIIFIVQIEAQKMEYASLWNKEKSRNTGGGGGVCRGQHSSLALLLAHLFSMCGEQGGMEEHSVTRESTCNLKWYSPGKVDQFNKKEATQISWLLFHSSRHCRGTWQQRHWRYYCIHLHGSGPGGRGFHLGKRNESKRISEESIANKGDF